ncbi:unnamed protein product (macronuclear) [Paramecium tetraurelia]|uniref:Transmembrane protein n=1 Tax=Paramecium tetraurelia TaxID=5888 RepID=A0DW04_PARTE|nr:uncharacterized protein GSPATT00020874001 [Paramecium tetraurelia]CAK87221.1 unnamed protein product [Paramecium tetraurelia]|eukprot:XP_001454618.1 hypothetical protein (macronuclear) [Paramecium tetraurelia strain d4-2]
MDPFIPIQTNQKSIVRIAFDILFLFIKLPLFAFLIVEIVIINDLIFRQIQRLEFHILFHKFMRIIILLHNYISGRLLLLVLGYFKYKSLFHSSAPNFKHGNLQSYCFYCSRTSPIDVFILITYFSPSFTHTSIQKDRVKCKIISYGKAILESFYISKCGFKRFTDGENIKDLMNQIRKTRTGPLILFWEGGITNGYSLLKIDKAIINETYNIYNFSQEQPQRSQYFGTNPQGILCLQHEDRMNLDRKQLIIDVNQYFNQFILQFRHVFLKMSSIQFQGSTPRNLLKVRRRYHQERNSKIFCHYQSDQSWKDFRKLFVQQDA